MTHSLPPRQHVARQGFYHQPPQHKSSVNDPAQFVQLIRLVIKAITDGFPALPTTDNTTSAILVQTPEQPLHVVLDDAFVVAEWALLQPFETCSSDFLFRLHAFVEHQELFG